MNRRGTTPITGTADRTLALAEIREILSGEPTETDREYARLLTAAIEKYAQYCDELSDKPEPSTMLRYQLEVVKKISVEQAARETGIADLDCLIHAERAFTAQDIDVLSNYFGITADQFSK